MYRLFKFRLITAILGTLSLASGLSAATTYSQKLVKLWSVDNIFNMPESAAYDEMTGQIFVSNVNQYAKDGNGFISRISASGDDIQLEWLTGLNSPTGMSIYKRKLYVADYDALVIVDIESGEIKARIDAPDEKPSLNDVAISNDGQVFVTGSSSSSIYKLNNNRLEVWKHDKTLLKSANGLFVRGTSLVHGGLNWSIFNLSDKKLASDFKMPDSAINDIDGITAYGCDAYLVSLIEDPRLWVVNTDGDSYPLSEAPINAIDIQYHGGRLYAPIVGGGLSVFSLPEPACLE